MNLSLLIIVPLITAVCILVCSGSKQVRVISLLGSVVQLLLAVYLMYSFWNQPAGNNSPMSFEQNYSWFSSLRINYHVGVDGISIAMILLTAFVVLAGVLVSWIQEAWSKEFFFLLMLL